jgi:NDP-sugar pyrophosphorylase family protein
VLNIVIPAAGRGRRFLEAGYVTPKPFIRLREKPMIEHVIDSVRPTLGWNYRFTLLVQADALRFLTPAFAGMTIIAVDGVTDGAARTVLLAKHIIDTPDPLLIVNSDQIIHWSVDDFLLSDRGRDGMIATFTATGPQYSYVRHDRGVVQEVAEKRVISDTATAGAYWWRRGAEFVRCAEAMIADDERVNGEFYVAPVYNYLLNPKTLVTTYPVDGVDQLGTPEDLRSYRDAHLALRAV